MDHICTIDLPLRYRYDNENILEPLKSITTSGQKDFDRLPFKQEDFELAQLDGL